MNNPPYGEETKKAYGHFATLQVKAQDSPNMTVRVSAGGFWVYGSNGATYVEFTGGNSPTISAPSSNSKLVVIALNTTGHVVLIDGAIAADPVLPAIPKGRYPLAFVRLSSTSTKITNDMVADARPFFACDVRFHQDLQENSQVDCHPITSITDLEDRLNLLVLHSDLVDLLADKADVEGTPSQTFLFNKDEINAPSEDIYFGVERGSSINVYFRWKEDLNLWQYTNNGTDWYPVGSARVISSDDQPVLSAGDNCIWVDTLNTKYYLLFSVDGTIHVKTELV